ncbi:MAG: tRNA (guanosine(37)-N1)-methyltransferase TrmD [Deltaproteobacteria bacterium]|nr:tRNA (guanosine(37)-N1)-methyltransferase TrmD [Deltaproteobacteria bacterium]
MRFDLLTLHPELVRSPLEHSILGRAQKAGLIQAQVHEIRTFGRGRYRQVDDSPYGGGAGMVMRVDVVHDAIKSVAAEGARVILMSPGGVRFNQAHAKRLSTMPQLIFVCGHYEGIDARIEQLVDEELSIGDYVLTGGELAALVIIEAVARLVPGVLGNEASSADESFSNGLIEYPQYTRPREYEGMEVPEILLSGHHAEIERWRLAQSKARTRARRPDLLPEGGN